MSDFESRLKALEDAREAQDRENAVLLKGQAELYQGQAELYQGQAELYQGQAKIREEQAALNTKIEAVRHATTERIQCELQLAWRDAGKSKKLIFPKS
jgi:hypothetical protein